MARNASKKNVLYTGEINGNTKQKYKLYIWVTSDVDKDSVYAFDVLRGRGQGNGLDGIAVANTLANYIHIHACSHPNFAYNFTRNIAELD